MTDLTTPLDSLAPDHCLCEHPHGCVCAAREKAIRFIIEDGEAPPLTDEQREWCLAEIDRVEGFSREDCADMHDMDLAQTVLDAWTDYCRDKGLI
jgi:hypothetical protein